MFAQAIDLVCRWDAEHIRVIPFGSMRFGGNVKSSDIDLCVVADSSKSRADISGFIAHVRESVEHVIPVLDTYVPVVKFRMHSGLECDVVFCFTTLPTVRATGDIPIGLWVENCVSAEDERSLHGVVATETVLHLVPAHRKTVFPTLLRSAKEWAQTRDIYSNPMGFLNGMSLAVMCCLVCITTHHEYPDAMMFRQFIRVFATWNWATTPVTLIAPTEPVAIRWMNVMTPTHTPINTLHNVGASQFTKITREFLNAAETIHFPVFEYRNALSQFFRTNHMFVAIRMTNGVAWQLKIESRVKRLLRYLETIDLGPEACTHVFERKTCTWMFVALAQQPTDTSACARFLHELTPFPSTCTVTVDLIYQKDLPAFVFEPDPGQH